MTGPVKKHSVSRRLNTGLRHTVPRIIRVDNMVTAILETILTLIISMTFLAIYHTSQMD